MSIMVELSIPAAEFILGKALKESPGLTIDIEQMVPTGRTAIPYIWVAGTDHTEFEDVLDREPELRAYEPLDEIDDRRLYRLEWDPTADTFVQTMVDHDVVLLQASGDHEVWTFQLRFPDSHALSEFHTACRKGPVDLTVERLYNPIEPSIADTREMTDAQRDIILRAYEAGYFDVPRRITLEELADRLDISGQAVNERMRRGLSALIATTVKRDSDADD